MSDNTAELSGKAKQVIGISCLILKHSPSILDPPQQKLLITSGVSSSFGAFLTPRAG